MRRDREKNNKETKVSEDAMQSLNMIHRLANWLNMLGFNYNENTKCLEMLFSNVMNWNLVSAVSMLESRIKDQLNNRKYKVREREKKKKKK